MAEKNKKQFQQQLFGDIEYASEVLRRIKKEMPETDIDLGLRVGLDAYAFEQGKMSKKKFEEKLLNIKTDPRRMGTRRGDKQYETRGAYYPDTDAITLFGGASRAFERELTPDPEGGSSYKRTPQTGEAGRFMIAVHELRHRGNNLLNKLGLIDYNVNLHSDTDYDDFTLRENLQIRHTLPEYEKKANREIDEKRSKTRKKKIKKIYKKSKTLQDRYPGAYNKGGKVYTNQLRRVRISRGR
jgi:hypothetical protein